MTGGDPAQATDLREHDSCGIGFIAHLGGQTSHRVVEMALEALGNLAHRGALSPDGASGDGVGVLTQLPRRFLRERFDFEIENAGGEGDRGGEIAAGMFFWPPGCGGAARGLIAGALGELGFEVAAWREVPTRPELLGEAARRSCPAVRQALVRCPSGLDGETIERRLYRARRRIERRRRRAAEADGTGGAGIGGLTVVSLSHRTLVYKALCLASRLGEFYPDLVDPAFETALALFHQRFSTNTAATWRLAQPFRFLAHNGEINTLQGNVNWMTARERELARSAAAGADGAEGVDDVLPVLEDGGSDSALLDNALEFLVRGGRDPLHAMMMLIPEAPRPGRDPRRAAFFDYHAGLMEPWDGPAAVVFSDGRIAGALLDRNGLRPQRYWLTDDGLVVLGSETGIVDLPDERIRRKGRLGPGEVLAADVTTGELLLDGAIKRRTSRRRPYREWLRRHRLEPPPPSPTRPPPEPDPVALLRIQAAFGYSREVFDNILEPMMRTGKPPLGSMGNDAPPAVLSRQPQLLYAYFRQRFAQVTNPPIDSLRERAVFSLETLAGAWGSPLEERPEAAALIRLPAPVVRTELFEWLCALDDPRFRAATLPALFDPAGGGAGLEAALEELCGEAERAVDGGATLIVLSDRGTGPERAPIPMLLATAGVHHHLVRRRKRMQATLVCDTGEPREDHHVACLIGYGATVVHPWLAYRTLAARARAAGLDPGEAIERYLAALEIALLKIMGKLGVCAITSYQGAQLFEALGLDPAVIDACFPGTPCRIAGAGWETLAASAAAFHREAWAEAETLALPDRGHFRFRRDGEHHALNPRVFKALHKAVDGGGDAPASYRKFADEADGGPPSSLRDLLEWRRGEAPLDLAAVEPAAPILQRFSTAAMSHGALSREAHETLAVAMNRLGGRSNSGEGGEDPERFVPYENGRRPRWFGSWRPGAGDWGNSAIKQIASGRFGVSAHYLASAREIEIKIAQGSKPGEGGEIPGHKVTAEIAALRRSGAGRTLISPPPHHDIYSIEDLAQLIYDLRRVHPEARIGVKLVAGTGVGTIAVGVAKAYADYVQISGDCGGTGASTLSSIKHAGLPWELGLAETQRALVASGLRERVALRVDGGLKTGRDVVLAALLGADEFGFGTAPLIALGCIMARQCHLNTCPTGIATQKEELRRKFTGRPEQVEAYLGGVAGQVREILAEMGFSRLDEVVGRVDLLRRRERADGAGAGVDVSALLAGAAVAGPETPRHRRLERNPRPEAEPPLDERVWEACREAMLEGRRLQASFAIRNSERTVGARLAGGIARHTAGRGIEERSIVLDFEGVAGQSFGAFAVRGMVLRLTGEAQDYAGKGMSGGELILRPPPARRLHSARHVIAGNTLLYGATGGRCFAAGRAGERFAVRNSGATAVVEGCGDYGCEYMTGGVVVVLGPVGRSFGAGMTGGAAFVLDRRGSLDGFLDPEMVRAEPLTSAEDCALLLRLIRRHEAETGSGLAHRLLAGWERTSAAFRRVVPVDDSVSTAAAGEGLAAGVSEGAARFVRTEPWMPRATLAARGR